MTGHVLEKSGQWRWYQTLVANHVWCCIHCICHNRGLFQPKDMGSADAGRTDTISIKNWSGRRMGHCHTLGRIIAHDLLIRNEQICTDKNNNLAKCVLNRCRYASNMEYKFNTSGKRCHWYSKFQPQVVTHRANTWFPRNMKGLESSMLQLANSHYETEIMKSSFTCFWKRPVTVQSS